jgi:hypothetical protein
MPTMIWPWQGDNDLALARAIKNSSATVVLGYFFHMNEATLNYRIEQKEIDRQLQGINVSKYPLIIYADQEAAAIPFIKAYAPESNLEIFTKGFLPRQPIPQGILMCFQLRTGWFDECRSSYRAAKISSLPWRCRVPGSTLIDLNSWSRLTAMGLKGFRLDKDSSPPTKMVNSS